MASPGSALALATAWIGLLASPAGAATTLATCLDAAPAVRLARVLDPDGRPVYARVVAQEAGVPTAVVPIPGEGDLASLFERAAGARGPVWTLTGPARVCAPFELPQRALDEEAQVVVAAGLNYASHADEAGGGDVFVFPKPVEPGSPYGAVAAPAGATLLDYEVELGFVLLEDVALDALPSRETLLARSAFFVANDLTDREPIIVHKTLSGMGTGFVEAKGQPGFLPAGPWMVRGDALFAALAACGGEGLGLELAVDEGDGFRTRQDATTAAMILDPAALLARVADEVARSGIRTAMPVRRGGEVRHYPLAVTGSDGGARLPAGSAVLTGTPEGVALQAPSPIPVLIRGLLHLRGPFEQFRREERARAAAGGPGGYLEPGDRVRARIDGLGAQIVRIAEPGKALPPDPCAAPGG